MKLKRVFFLLFALALVLAPAQLLAGSRRPLEESVTIWTATDLHYIAPDLLAETFANINSAYFSGQPIREADFAEGIALWRKQDGFVSRYIDTMLESGQKDNLHLVIQ